MRCLAKHKMLGWLGVLALTFIFINRAHASSITVTAIVSDNCGNNQIDTGEECDGTNLNGMNCQVLGAGSGSLSCGSNCLFNTTSCSVPPPEDPTPPPPVNVGGGPSAPPAAIITTAIFSGHAYPNSIVTLLKDSAVLASTTAGTDANFEISVSGISGGNYLFSLYSEDGTGNRSSLSNLPILINIGATVKVSGIFLAPTISTNKQEVKAQSTITFSGKSTPNASITISVYSNKETLHATKADANGLYSYTYTPKVLGNHLAKARASINGETSTYGRSINFQVGTEDVFKKVASVEKDLNGDNKVNLVDFSIMAYWYKRVDAPARLDLNGDNKIDLVDFSIMAFYWTG